MTTSKAEVVVLHCDQGMGTLVRIWEEVMGSEELTHLVLVDLGSDTRTRRYAGDAVAYVIDSLKAMDTPQIDLVILSHQDFDHWSLLPDLIKKIETDVPATKILGCYRGGERWKKGALSAVTQMEHAFGISSVPLPKRHSDYSDPAGGKGELAGIEGVSFRVLAVNAPSTKSIENGTSAVIVVEFGGSQSILPGDATSETLGFINAILDEWAENPVRPCFLLTAPHHGSLRTLAGNFTKISPNLDIATEFAGKLEATWVAASAGYESHFYHPFKQVMAILAVKAGATAVQHTYVVYEDSSNTWEAVSDTKENVFTTIASLDDPPVRKSWKFVMKPSGLVTFEAVSSTGDLGWLHSPRDSQPVE